MKPFAGALEAPAGRMLERPRYPLPAEPGGEYPAFALYG
jgi:hypothetical protein